MTTKQKKRAIPGRAYMKQLIGPLTLGNTLEAIRKGEEWTLEHMGQLLGVSRAYLCDVEKGRRVVSPARAAEWAHALGYHEQMFVQLALQAEVDAAHLRLTVKVEPRRRAKSAA